MIKDIIISLMVTTIISLAAAYIGKIIYSSDFLQVLVGAFLVQVAGFYLWNSYMQLRMRGKLEEEETERARLYETQGISSQCAYCNAVNFIPIRLDEDNEYTCTECDNMNSVYVQVTTARRTDITDRLNLEVSTYIKDKVKAASELRKKDE
jgi:hypothetical protein